MIYSTSAGSTSIKLNSYTGTNIKALNGYGGGVSHLGTGSSSYIEVETTGGSINPTSATSYGGFIYATGVATSVITFSSMTITSPAVTTNKGGLVYLSCSSLVTFTLDAFTVN